MTITYKMFPRTPPSVRINSPICLSYDFWTRTSISYSFSLVESDYPNGQSYFSRDTAQIMGRDLLLCSGFLSGPSKSLFDETVWELCVQYFKCFRPSPGQFRLISKVRTWDERKKGLLSETLSIGLTGYTLWNYDDVVHIADAGPFIGRTIEGPYLNIPYLSLKNKGIYGKNGGYKPDFICITKNGDCVIVESKGCIGPPSCLSPALKKGKQQVSNVEPAGIQARAVNSRLVFGANIRYEDDNVRTGKDSTLKVVDPVQDDEPISIDLNSDEVIISAYRSIFLSCGLEDIVFLLDISNEAVLSEEFIQRFTVQIDGIPIFPIFTSQWLLIGLYQPVAIELLAHPRIEVTRRITKSLLKLWEKRIDVQKTPEILLLPNGITASRNIIESDLADHAASF